MRPSPERWSRLRPIVARALELAPAEVTGFLENACEGDERLLSDARRLLDACRAAEGSLRVLETPAAELAAPLLEARPLTYPAPDELVAGVTIGSYTIERLLGRGGMGIVYLARDERLERPVALKLLSGWLEMTETAKRRFEHEARAASRRDHANIETVYEIGETADGRLYLAMAYYEGETLRRLLAGGALDVSDALELACQIADGLGAAHADGIVHRDIKPGNVIVTPDGVAKILDFGAAKITGRHLTRAGATLGTVAYMSPEQTRGEDVDAASDVWSLGVVMYEMLAGRHPFPTHDSDVAIHAIRNDDPEPLAAVRPEISAALAGAVHRCLERDPRARFRDGRALADELRRTQLAMASGASDPARGSSTRSRRRTVAAALGGALVVAGALWSWSSRAGGGGDVLPSQITLAILPFQPVTIDTALGRLGRELVVTLGASLDGVGGLRVAEPLTILAQIDPAERPSLERAARLARDLGARSFVHGTLVRAGDGVRLDIGLFHSADRSVIARVTASGARDDVSALTDSAALAVLRPLWRGRAAPAPNPNAITTRSLPALRAYLEGELAFARAEYDVAVPAFERAFAEDSTFWLAYWRSLHPRIYERSRPDSAVVARIVARRHELGDPERSLVEAEMAATLEARLASLRAVTARFSDYWPGWYRYADQLMHAGPYVGTTSAETLDAFERLTVLNPDFAAGWQHLLYAALRERDTSAADRAIERLGRLESGDAFLLNPDNMAYFRALAGALRTGGEFPDTVAARLADIALRLAPRVSPEIIATSTLHHGFPAAQLAQSRAILARRPPRELAASQWMGIAFSWAARGAWDSAFVAAAEWVRWSVDADAALRAYGMAVVGAMSGGAVPESAHIFRPAATRASLRDPDRLAELAWLDGILAYARGDADGVARSRDTLRTIPATDADLLRASLDAFHARATGDTSAALALAALEWDIAQRGRHLASAGTHPYLGAVHRLPAARWVLERGDTLRATRLLAWHEALLAGDPSYGRVSAANRLVEPIAVYERARLADAQGRSVEALALYRRFLDRYDMPPAPHEAWVAAARIALARLGRGEAPL